MQIRQAKKLLKQYPPIIEIMLPDHLCTEDLMQKIRYEFKSRVPKGIAVLIVPIDLDSLKLRLPLISVGTYEEKLEKFRKAWEEACRAPIVIDNKLNWESIEPFSFVEIHTVLKDGEYVYRKQKDRINKMIEELSKNATL